MAIFDALKLIKNNSDQFAPALVSVLIGLITELATLCDDSNLSLSLIPAFQHGTNEWHLTLLQIYESLIVNDRLKQKIGKPVAPLQKSFSKPLETFIEFLHRRRVKLSSTQESPETNFFKTRLGEINHRATSNLDLTTKQSKPLGTLPDLKIKPNTPGKIQHPYSKSGLTVSDEKLEMLERHNNLVSASKIYRPAIIASPESKQDHVRKKITAMGLEWPFKEELITEQSLKQEQEIAPIATTQLLAFKKLEGFRDQSKSNSAGKRKRRHFTRRISNLKEDLKTQTQIYSQFEEIAHEPNIQPKHKRKQKQKKPFDFPLILEDNGYGLGSEKKQRNQRAIGGFSCHHTANYVPAIEIQRKTTQFAFQRLNSMLTSKSVSQPINDNSLPISPVTVNKNSFKKIQTINPQPKQNLNALRRSSETAFHQNIEAPKGQEQPARPKSREFLGDKMASIIKDKENLLGDKRSSITTQDKKSQVLKSVSRNSALQLAKHHLSTEPEPISTERQAYKSIDSKKNSITITQTGIPSNFIKYESSIQFNILGLINTQTDKSFYRVTACYNDESHQFSDPDWHTTSTLQYRFKSVDEIVVQEKAHLVDPNRCIIYQIMRFNQTTQEWDANFAYAVQPVFQIAEEQLFIIGGQFQLPLFAGQVPAVLKNNLNPMKTLKNLVRQQSVVCVDFVQLISRVSDLNCTEPFLTKWWPEVDTQMSFVQIPIKSNLWKYVLHAKHANLEKESRNLCALFASDFKEIWRIANS